MARDSNVTLKSSDGQLFEVSGPVAFKSEHINNMVQELGTAEVIPLPNVSGKILSKVIEYCKYHVEAQNSALTDDEIKTWDQEFVKGDQDTVFGLFMVFSFKPLFNWKFGR